MYGPYFLVSWHVSRFFCKKKKKIRLFKYKHVTNSGHQIPSFLRVYCCCCYCFVMLLLFVWGLSWANCTQWLVSFVAWPRMSVLSFPHSFLMTGQKFPWVPTSSEVASLRQGAFCETRACASLPCPALYNFALASTLRWHGAPRGQSQSSVRARGFPSMGNVQSLCRAHSQVYGFPDP